MTNFPAYVLFDKLSRICIHSLMTLTADGDTAEEIIKNPANAMDAAKSGGKNCWRFYTAAMQTEAYEKMRLIHSLRYALEAG